MKFSIQDSFSKFDHICRKLFTEEILNGKLYFFAVHVLDAKVEKINHIKLYKNDSMQSKQYKKRRLFAQNFPFMQCLFHF